MDFCVISASCPAFDCFQRVYHVETQKKKNKVRAHVQHVRRKAKKLSPCVPYILFAFFWCRHGPVSGEGKKEAHRTGGRHAHAHTQTTRTLTHQQTDHPYLHNQRFLKPGNTSNGDMRTHTRNSCKRAIIGHMRGYL
jgi:hypothetical protein